MSCHARCPRSAMAAVTHYPARARAWNAGSPSVGPAKRKGNRNALSSYCRSYLATIATMPAWALLVLMPVLVLGLPVAPASTSSRTDRSRSDANDDADRRFQAKLAAAAWDDLGFAVPPAAVTSSRGTGNDAIDGICEREWVCSRTNCACSCD